MISYVHCMLVVFLTCGTPPLFGSYPICCTPHLLQPSWHFHTASFVTNLGSRRPPVVTIPRTFIGRQVSTVPAVFARERKGTEVPEENRKPPLPVNISTGRK